MTDSVSRVRWSYGVKCRPGVSLSPFSHSCQLCQTPAARARIRWQTRAQTPAGMCPPWSSRELAFEGVVDRFVPLADPTELAEPGLLVFAVGTDEGGVQRGDGLFELVAGEAFVADHDLLPGEQSVVSSAVEHRRGDVAFGLVRGRQTKADRHPVRGAQQVQAQSPEVARMRGAAAVGGPAGQLGALAGLARLAARDRGNRAARPDAPRRPPRRTAARVRRASTRPVRVRRALLDTLVRHRRRARRRLRAGRPAAGSRDLGRDARRLAPRSVGRVRRATTRPSRYARIRGAAVGGATRRCASRSALWSPARRGLATRPAEARGRRRTDCRERGRPRHPADYT